MSKLENYISLKELESRYELSTYLEGLVDASHMTPSQLEQAIDHLIDYD
jgi:hypothetical protein